MGEDIDFDKSQSSDSHSHKFGNLSINGPQQESSESSPLTVGLKQGFATHTDYDKLCLSLRSCLPNEQELALNVCTILSNEGNYMLHLEQTPKLVELLVAQTGVWSVDDSSLKMMYLECWKGLKGRNVHRFWRSCLDLENKDLIELLGLDLGDYDPNFSLLNLEIDLGIHNIEGQRVSRVALILHNLSFEKNNVPVLVSSKTFIRFMLLCIHSSYGNLKQIAYDTLSNLACAIKLSFEKDLCSRLIFKIVIGGIISYDRYMNVRSMDILAQLCSNESSEDIIPSLLDIEVYRQMVSFLTVHDILLLFNALEALYALSDLGRYACDKIVSVHRCIGALVSLLTLEPNEYGPSGQINMKVVKTLVPVDADTEKEDSNAATEEESSSPAPTSAPTAVSSTEVDSETFAVNWLRSTYEVLPGKSVSRNEIYSDYLTYCTKAGRKDIANANIFTEYVRKTFPSCGVKKMESKGIITFHHEGLQRKNSAAQTGLSPCKPVMNTNTIQKASTTSTPVTKTNQKTTFNSILKSQLSSALKSNVAVTPIKSQSSAAVSNQKLSNAPFSPAVTPRTASPTVIANAGSSTLIKSLLASKVQQRNLQPQIVPQNVSKMVIYSPGTSVGFGSHTTVVRCIRPGSLHAVNLGTQLRTPLQTCLVSNSGRIIANATPRFIKNTPVIRHNVQQQVIKQNVPSSPTPRVNGLQKDVPMEEEVFKISKDVPASVITHTSSEQNHVSKDHGIAQHSTLSNGQDQQVLKSVNISDLSVNCSSGIQNFDMHKLAVSKELPISQHMINSKPPSTESSPSKEQKESSINFDNNNSIANISLEQSSVQSTKALSSPTSILKHVLSDLDTQTDHLSKQQLLQKDICKRAPLLNGLLDKGKLPVQGHIQTNAFVLNGSEPNTAIQTVDVINSKENKPSQFVQLNQNSIVIPVSSLNTVMSAPQSNLILMPVSSVNSVIPSSTLNSSILAAASVNSTTAFISTSSPSVQFSNSVLPSTTFLSNGSNLMQLCIGQTTLSGTAEVQSDQQGVVRLHIESPENSNQGSDLSSISDITRTLECASKALLKTNVDCSSQVPFSGTCETTSSTSLITTNSSTLSRTSQQFFVVTPTLNQPQIQIPQPNIKFHILHSLPKVEDSVDLIGFPSVNVNQSLQLQQSNVNQSIQIQQSNVNQTIQLQQSNVNQPIQLQQSNVNQSIQLQQSNVNQSIQLQQSNINQSMQLQPPNVNQSIQLQQSNVNQAIQMQQPLVNQSIQLQQPNVSQSLQLQPNINQSIQLQQPNVNQSIQLQQPNVNQSIQVQQSNVNQAIQLQQSNVNQAIQLQQSNVNQSLQLQQSNVNQSLQLQQSNLNQSVQLQHQPTMNQSVQLQQSIVNQSVHMPQSNISQSVQLQQSLPETSTTSTTCLKRPSNDTSLIQTFSNAKKPCIETKTSLLAESLRLPTSVPCTFDLASVSAKPSQETSVKSFQETKSVVVKSPQTENSELSSKLTTAKITPKPLQKVDVLHDKGARTFSGLSSVNSNQAQPPPSPVPPKSAAGLEFLCEWKNCGLKFKSPALVYLHATKVHAPLNNNDMVCLWEGCDIVRRKRLSHLTHLQDWHCNEVILQTQAMRRKQISQTGKSSIAAPQKPPPHPGYAPDAAMLAIKRHALQYINPKELSEEKESVLTKSIRLTSALILRNLVTHSTLARTYVRRFEPELAYLAMSPVESARTLAQCLSQLHSVND